jgi:hypothetical protein
MSKASKISPATLPPTDLYERDYYTWTQEQARALREHRTEELDWANVAEEIEDLGKRGKARLAQPTRPTTQLPTQVRIRARGHVGQ